MKPAYIVISKSPKQAKWWWWKLVGSNGRIICSTEGFTRRGDAIRAATNMVNTITNRELIWRIQESTKKLPRRRSGGSKKTP